MTKLSLNGVMNVMGIGTVVGSDATFAVDGLVKLTQGVTKKLQLNVTDIENRDYEISMTPTETLADGSVLLKMESKHVPRRKGMTK